MSFVRHLRCGKVKTLEARVQSRDQEIADLQKRLRRHELDFKKLDDLSQKTQVLQEVAALRADLQRFLPPSLLG